MLTASKPSPLGVSFGGPAALRKRIDNTLLIGIPLAGSIATPFWFANHPFGWIEVLTFAISYVVAGIGVGLGLHRYFTHKSFEPVRWLAWSLAAAGSMAFQGSVLRWVADHRRHHAHADVCGDPHSPAIDSHCKVASSGWRGLLHAHLGWMFDDSVTDYQVYGSDLLRDPVVMFFHRTFWFWPALALAVAWCLGYLLGGIEHAWGCLLFGGCLSTTVLHNVTWAVNSIGHAYGYERYPTGNNSKNNLIVALLSFGEGWHNNHHNFPRSAFHGLTASEIDVSGKLILLLEAHGLITKVVRYDPATGRAIQTAGADKGG
jgi:stearoyl-CoA desaturase (delta-9 desaturase)